MRYTYEVAEQQTLSFLSPTTAEKVAKEGMFYIRVFSDDGVHRGNLHSDGKIRPSLYMDEECLIPSGRYKSREEAERCVENSLLNSASPHWWERGW